MKISYGEMSVEELVDKQDDIDLVPWFQRKKVWNTRDDSLLIDTILKDWDVPKLYFRISNLGKYEVVDGHQRLLAIFNFIKKENGYDLKGDVGFTGRTFYNLPPEKQAQILSFRFQITYLSDATEEEIALLFKRLQLGKRLVSAEKLNAERGGMSDFIKELAKHRFFPEKTYLSEARFGFLQCAAQLAHLDLVGLSSAKLNSLLRMYKRYYNFSPDLEAAQRIQRNLDIMYEMVPARSDLLSNRAVVLSFYDLILALRKREYAIERNQKLIAETYFDFLRELRKQVRLGAIATKPQLLEFHLHIYAGADGGTAIRKRHKILLEELLPEFGLRVED